MIFAMMHLNEVLTRVLTSEISLGTQVSLNLFAKRKLQPTGYAVEIEKKI